MIRKILSIGLLGVATLVQAQEYVPGEVALRGLLYQWRDTAAAARDSSRVVFNPTRTYTVDGVYDQLNGRMPSGYVCRWDCMIAVIDRETLKTVLGVSSDEQLHLLLVAGYGFGPYYNSPLKIADIAIQGSKVTLYAKKSYGHRPGVERLTLVPMN